MGGAALRTALLTPCSLAFGLAFVPAVALPSALAAAALGVLAGTRRAGARRSPPRSSTSPASLASLAATLLEGWLGPASYLLDPFLGIWPGPIYDEALALDRRLLLFRLATLAWTAAMLGAAQAVAAARRRTPPARSRAGARRGRARAPRRGGAVRVVGARTGDLATRAGMDRVLGGRLAGARCDLHFPREKPAADAERLFRDCEADVAEVAAALGVAHPPVVKVWVHRSDGGEAAAGRRRPHRVHQALARRDPGARRAGRAAGPAPRDCPRGGRARWRAGRSASRRGLGVLVDAGLVEGLAVALEVPRGEWTVHEWARAMKDLGLLPAAASLVEPAGFFSAPAARAYGASGSFLAFLLERRGPGPVLRAYAGAPFAEAFGAPIGAARGGLARLPRRRCRSPRSSRWPPRPASARPGSSGGAAPGRRPASRPGPRPPSGAASLPRRRRLWRRAARLSGDPSDLRGAGDALRGSDPAAADAAYAEALAALGAGSPALRSALLESRGDLAWRSGDAPGAAARYREALALHPDRARARLLTAKVAAATGPGARRRPRRGSWAPARPTRRCRRSPPPPIPSAPTWPDGTPPPGETRPRPSRSSSGRSRATSPRSPSGSRPSPRSPPRAAAWATWPGPGRPGRGSSATPTARPTGERARHAALRCGR